jgi:hypothetical protein
MKPPPGPPQQFPDNFTAWLDRHPYLSVALQIVAAIILAAITFFLWIVDAEKYAITTGVVTICLILSMFIKKAGTKP